MAGDRDPGPRLLRGGLAGDFGQALRSSESAVKASTGRSARNYSFVAPIVIVTLFHLGNRWTN
jgi:hypothetical protein